MRKAESLLTTPWELIKPKREQKRRNKIANVTHVVIDNETKIQISECCTDDV